METRTIVSVMTAKTVGIGAVPVNVEVLIDNGVGIHLVGLADAAVKESLLRVVTALQARGYRIPGKKVVINLAPADLCKNGAAYDLPIALGIIAASGQEQLTDIDKYVFAGEIGLDGSLRDIPGWMQYAELAAKNGRACILPTESAKLAAYALQGEATVYGADDIAEVIDILKDGAPDWTALDECGEVHDGDLGELAPHWWDDIKGQAGAKRALEIAAAGGHPLLLMGVPGSQRSALAKALNEILPRMSLAESQDVQRIYSVAGKRIIPCLRPFRSPSVAAYLSALMGGGSGDSVRPGEVSLAHNGVLYIADFNEMPKSSMEALRAPMEDGEVTISRLRSKTYYPAKFFPVFAVNPCPCGYYGEGDRCTCTPTQRKVYLSRIYGPIADRLTMQVWVHPPVAEDGLGFEPWEVVAERVAMARERQIARQGKLNDELTAEVLGRKGFMSEECAELVEKLFERLNLSTRAYSRIAKMARTIADLEGSAEILPQHIAEASSYRFLDRQID